jgi:thiol-disulfide isomerase/thioredoxin
VNAETGAVDSARGSGPGYPATLAHSQYIQAIDSVCAFEGFTLEDVQSANTQYFWEVFTRINRCREEVRKYIASRNNGGRQAFSGYAERERRYRVADNLMTMVYAYGGGLRDSLRRWNRNWLEHQLDSILGAVPRFDAEMAVSNTNFRFFYSNYFDKLIYFSRWESGRNTFETNPIQEANDGLRLLAGLPVSLEMKGYLAMRLGQQAQSDHSAEAMQLVIDSLRCWWPAAPQLAHLNKRLQQMKVWAVGAQAGDFSLRDSLGRTHSLRQYRGKWVYLNITAPGCVGCAMDHPYYAQVHDSLGADTVRIVFLHITPETPEDNWRQALAARGTRKGPELLVRESELSAFQARYPYTGFPTHLLIDPNGIIVDKQPKRPGQGLTLYLREKVRQHR